MLQLALLRLLVDRLGFIQPVKSLVSAGEFGIVDCHTWLQAQRLSSFLQCLFPVSQAAENESQVSVRLVVSWVGLLVQLVSRRRLLQFPRPKQVVYSLDVEPLPFAYLLPQRVSLACILGRPPPLDEAVVEIRHPAVGRCKTRIQVCRPLIEGQRGCESSRKVQLSCQTVGLQRLQGWRGRLL